MKKGIVIVSWLLLMAGFSFGQTDAGPENQAKIKEVPAAENHGKVISQLAKETPGSPEKGKVISSAARQRGIQNREVPKSNAGNSNGNSGSNNGKKPVQTGKPANPPGKGAAQGG